MDIKKGPSWGAKAGEAIIGNLGRGDGGRFATAGSGGGAKKPGGLEKFAGYADIAKSDDEQRLVYGIFSTETPDAQGGIWKGERYDGDLVKADAIAGALDDYMRYANIREMHGSNAAGSAQLAHVEDGQSAIVVKVGDDGAWSKVKQGIYKGFSIGGRVLEAHIEKIGGRLIRVITKLQLTEISLVDRPACPDAHILVFKRDTSMDKIEKAADAPKVIGQIQALRNEAELAGDLDTASYYTQAIALLLLAAGDATADEPEPEGDEIAMSEEEPAADPNAVAMAAGADLKKAGRVFSGQNSGQMHKTVQALLQMMASAGDETAQKALSAYGPAQPDTAKAADQPSTGDALVKALGPQFESLQKSFTDALSGIEARLQQVEKQPAAGGPSLRSVNKTISTQPPTQQPQVDLTDLRKRANTEPDPVKRAAYTQQLIAAEASLGSR